MGTDSTLPDEQSLRKWQVDLCGASGGRGEAGELRLGGPAKREGLAGEEVHAAGCCLPRRGAFGSPQIPPAAHAGRSYGPCPPHG